MPTNENMVANRKFLWHKYNELIAKDPFTYTDADRAVMQFCTAEIFRGKTVPHEENVGDKE